MTSEKLLRVWITGVLVEIRRGNMRSPARGLGSSLMSLKGSE